MTRKDIDKELRKRKERDVRMVYRKRKERKQRVG
jgi:hypothetical protein